MTEPRFIRIYCRERAVEQVADTDSSRVWQNSQRGVIGGCFAEKVDGRWQCCCCGKPVSVVW